MSINSVNIVGNIGRDPELRSTTSGSHLLTFSVAVNDRVKDASGEWTDYCNWVDVVVFGNRAEPLSNILTKGMKVAVNGKLRYSSWERDGKTRSKLEVIANDIDIMQRRDDDGGGYNPSPKYSQPKQQPRRQARPQARYDDGLEDIQF